MVIFFLHLFHKRNFGDKWHRFLTGQMPFLSHNQQCQSIEQNKVLADPNHRKPFTGFILWSTAGLEREGSLLLLCWLCELVTKTKKTTAVLRPLYRSTCISWHLQLRTGKILLVQFYCPHALADGNQCIWIREKTLEFSATLLSALSRSPYISCMH